MFSKRCRIEKSLQVQSFLRVDSRLPPLEPKLNTYVSADLHHAPRRRPREIRGNGMLLGVAPSSVGCSTRHPLRADRGKLVEEFVNRAVPPSAWANDLRTWEHPHEWAQLGFCKICE